MVDFVGGGLAEKIPISSALTQELLSLSKSPEAFARESALRAIKDIVERGCCLSERDVPPLQQRLEQARSSESEEFILSLFNE